MLFRDSFFLFSFSKANTLRLRDNKYKKKKREDFKIDNGDLNALEYVSWLYSPLLGLLLLPIESYKVIEIDRVWGSIAIDALWIAIVSIQLLLKVVVVGGVGEARWSCI